MLPSRQLIGTNLRVIQYFMHLPSRISTTLGLTENMSPWRWAIVFMFAFFMTCANVIIFAPNLTLDGSWLLSVQRLAVEGRVLDGDYAFTYGALTPLMFPTPGSAVIALSCFMAIAAIAGLRIVQTFGIIPLVTFLLPLAFVNNIDGLILLSMACLLPLAVMRRPDILLVACIAVLCHVKYSTLMIAIGATIFIDVWRLAFDREKRPTNLISVLVAFLALYFLLGGSLLGLPKFFKAMPSVIFSYNEAMATYFFSALRIFVFAACSWLAVTFTLLALERRAILKFLTSSRMLVMILIAFTLYLLAKAGYTRADGHINPTWGSLVVLFGFVAGLAFWLVERRGTGALACAGLAAGLAFVTPFAAPPPNPFSSYLPVVSIDMAVWRKIARSAFNPGAISNAAKYRGIMTQQVSDNLSGAGVLYDTIDAYPTQIGDLALAAPNYDHRPVIQTYSSYDAYLQNRNADFLRKGGPETLLMFPIVDIDGRLTGQLLGPTYFEILSRYEQTCTSYTQPQSNEVSDVWRRRPQPVDLGLAFTATGSARLGEWVDIPAGLRTGATNPAARIDLGVRSSGKLIGLLFKPSKLMIEIDYGAGEPENRRFIRKAAEEGFPLLSKGQERLSGRAMDTSRMPIRFRLIEEANYLPYYEGHYEYDLGSYTMPSDGGWATNSQCIGARIRSALNPPYTLLESSTRLFSHADSSVSIEVLRGESVRLSPRMKDGAFPCSDGVLFEVRQAGSGPEDAPLWSHRIDSDTTEGTEATYTYTASDSGPLILTTRAGESSACDWSGWDIDWTVQ